jgi:type IV pilus assembly protein PilV
MEIHSKKGFTLVEALVALSILAILLLGLLSSLIVSYEISTKNVIRDEAVKIAEEYAEKYRNMDLNSIPASDTKTETRQIRNATVNFLITTTSTPISANKLKQVTITVEWNYKGKHYTHTITTIVGAT